MRRAHPIVSPSQRAYGQPGEISLRVQQQLLYLEVTKSHQVGFRALSVGRDSCLAVNLAIASTFLIQYNFCVIHTPTINVVLILHQKGFFLHQAEAIIKIMTGPNAKNADCRVLEHRGCSYNSLYLTLQERSRG